MQNFKQVRILKIVNFIGINKIFVRFGEDTTRAEVSCSGASGVFYEPLNKQALNKTQMPAILRGKINSTIDSAAFENIFRHFKSCSQLYEFVFIFR